MLRDLFPLMSF